MTTETKDMQEVQRLNQALEAAMQALRGAGGNPLLGGAGKGWEGSYEAIGERVREKIRQALRERVLEAVHAKMMEAMRERVRDLLRQKLMQELRNALLEGQFGQAGLDVERLGERLGERFSETLHERMAEAVREKIGEAIREKLHAAVREALLEGFVAQYIAWEETDAIATKIREKIENELREKIVQAIREKLREALYAAMTQGKPFGNEPETLLGYIRNRMVEALELRLLEIFKEQVRETILEVLEVVGRELLREAIRAALYERFHGMTKFGPGRTPNLGGYTGTLINRMLEAFYERVIENVREKVGEQVRERLATTIKQTLEDGLRARLGGAMRSACAEQVALGLGVDHEGFAEALKYRLIDGLREEVTAVVSEKVCVALRERFDEAVKDAMFRGLTPMRGETPFGQ